MRNRSIWRLTALFFLIQIFFMPVLLSAADDGPIPPACRQAVLVLTDSIPAYKGMLYRFSKSPEGTWQRYGGALPVVIGRNGLGRGAGLHDISDLNSLPDKQEGDGRSPAGIFRLGVVFGYDSAEQFPGLKMPYSQITGMTECVDDANSKWYNYVINRDTIGKADWQSSEKMRRQGIYYELGVIVDYNRNPVVKGTGSCIFIHNWAVPDEGMAGCTAMAPENMREVVNWLDAEAKPVLIQLTEPLYHELKSKWHLPAE